MLGQAACRAAGRRLGDEIDVVDRAGRAGAIDQIDQAAFEPADRRDHQLVRPDAPAEGLRLVAQRAFDRAARIVDAERERAHRRPMQQEEGMREGVLLGIEDQVHVALPVQRHVLGAMRGDMRKAHRVEHFGEARPRLGIDRELDELDAVAHRRGRRGEHGRGAGASAPASSSSSSSSERIASIAVGRGGAARNSSLKISSEIGPL